MHEIPIVNTVIYIDWCTCGCKWERGTRLCLVAPYQMMRSGLRGMEFINYIDGNRISYFGCNYSGMSISLTLAS